MNVLSLFDGMSCGQIALERAGIKADQYFAAEIKPHAKKVTQHNYPNTIQLGDVRGIKASELPKIDLLIGGSPCQDFSQANKIRLGLEGVKSGLFYEYLRLRDELKEINPDLKFILENVVMDDFSYSTISHLLGTFPVDINSSLVSAQLRQRSYWTDIGEESRDMFGMRHSIIQQPRDKKIILQSILTSGYTDRLKSTCLMAGYYAKAPKKEFKKLIKRYDMGILPVVFEAKDIVRLYDRTEMERLQTVPEGYTDCVPVHQAADLLGDGWTIDVIAHIFQGLKYIETPISSKLSA